ncbi:MAG: class I SAM-dependent methyltransferase [Planctomycetes bacterium]|nr:class I SAM-dependent methyltransferase [Planctomycetota bacterium]
MAKEHSIEPSAFAPILADLGLEPQALLHIDPSTFSETKGGFGRGHGDVFLGPIGTGLDIPAASALYKKHVEPVLGPASTLVLYFKSPRVDADLATWRNHFWPWLHIVGLYRIQGGAIRRESFGGAESLSGKSERDGFVLVAKRREHVMSPTSTTAKFDANAGGWNPQPANPGYAHYRWMRRYVGRFAKVEDGARVLDFGSGAGWVGIEAALQAKDVELCAFDPSPEMTRFAAENARAAGITKFTARVGFGEQPPFPGPGERTFDVVFSSGVVSFSPDIEQWCDGLASTLHSGSTLVIGDIQRESAGMQKRRANRILLPAREMNAQTPAEIRARLERRGLLHEATAGYQLTDPIPQLTHHADKKLGGVLSPLLLALNRAAAGSGLAPGRFDSWVMRFKKR